MYYVTILLFIWIYTFKEYFEMNFLTVSHLKKGMMFETWHWSKNISHITIEKKFLLLTQKMNLYSSCVFIVLIDF